MTTYGAKPAEPVNPRPMTRFDAVSAADVRVRPNAAFVGGPKKGKSVQALLYAQGLAASTGWSGRQGGVVLILADHAGDLAVVDDLGQFRVIHVNPNYSATQYFDALDAAINEFHAAVVVTDTLSAFWSGPGGIRAIVDYMSVHDRDRRGKHPQPFDSREAWAQARPKIDLIRSSLLTDRLPDGTGNECLIRVPLVCTLRTPDPDGRLQDFRGEILSDFSQIFTCLPDGVVQAGDRSGVLPAGEPIALDFSDGKLDRRFFEIGLRIGEHYARRYFAEH